MPSRAGSPNRNKNAALKLLQKQVGPDFHPLMEMAEMYVDLKKEGDAADKAHRVQLLKEMAQYTLPKLKAVEHKTEGGESMVPVFAMYAPGQKKK